MISGFYQSWNQFVNGGMVPAPDTSTTETNTADGGLHMHGSDATTVFDEDFDKNMLLLSAHVVMTNLDNTAYPTYEASTEGLRVNKVHNVLHQPPTAPAQDVSMAVTYMPVSTDVYKRQLRCLRPAPRARPRQPLRPLPRRGLHVRGLRRPL